MRYVSHEEDEKYVWESRLDADFQADDIPEDCKLQVDDDESSKMRSKEGPHDYALEFTDGARSSRIHPLPGGESIKFLLQEETVKMDEITISGSVSGLRIPPINKVHLVYAKHMQNLLSALSRLNRLISI